MAVYSTATSVKMTNPAITITNIVSAGFSPEVEKIMRNYQNYLPTVKLGNQTITATFTTTDSSVALGLTDGMEVSSFEIKYAGAMDDIEADDLVLSTTENSTPTVTFSKMIVNGPIEITADNEGKDIMQYTVNLLAVAGCTVSWGDGSPISS